MSQISSTSNLRIGRSTRISDPSYRRCTTWRLLEIISVCLSYPLHRHACSDTFQSHAVEDQMNVDERAVAADGMSLKRSHIKTSLFMFLLLFKKKKQTVTVDLHILDV
jgi:hypothetical protein